MAATQPGQKTLWTYISIFTGLAAGALMAALSLQYFLLPHHIIDGGIIGISMILASKFGNESISYFVILLNLPFVFLAYKHIRKNFVIFMGTAILLFALFLFILENFIPFAPPHFDPLEVIVFGGALLGIGAGLIIRNGGCTDGTEILAIIINRKKGFTVGQVVLAINIVIFIAYGLITRNLHIALQSLMTYIVAFKMIDLVITGLDEMKSVMIISSEPDKIRLAIIEKLNLGITVIHGEGGFSGEARRILFVIVERLDLAELKELVLKKDPQAFMAIENLHEVVTGKSHKGLPIRRKRKKSKSS